MKFLKLYIPIFFICLYVLLIIGTVIFFSFQDTNTTPIIYLKNWLLKLDFVLIPDKPIFDYLISVIGFFLTALGFGFVVVQISTLADQTNKQEEQYHKDSEFKNFLEATKMLTGNKYNADAQISAMYLLYDYAKKHSNKDNGGNLEKVIKVLNRYAMAVYDEIEKLDGDNRKITINEWKEHGKGSQQVASTALELNKKLFVYALEHKIKINLSDVIIFDLDIEKDFSNSKVLRQKFRLFEIIKHSPRITFLCCKLFSNENRFLFKFFKKEIDFSTNYWWLIRIIRINKKNVKSRMDISLSYFIECDLTECNFSYSNLWGVSFKDCQLYKTNFKQAECTGSEFNETCDISEQLTQKQMLFIDENIFDKFNSEYKRTEDKDEDDNKLKYAIVYSKDKNCFQNTEEYKDFVKFRKKYDTNLKKIDTKTNVIKKFLCQKICKNM